MWVMAMFDLPVTTKEHRREYRQFVDFLEDNGFFRVQFSVYIRPCASDENAGTHIDRLRASLPPAGEIRVLKFTDKQWGRMQIFRAGKTYSAEEAPSQFNFFETLLTAEDNPETLPQVAQGSRPYRTTEAPGTVSPDSNAVMPWEREDAVARRRNQKRKRKTEERNLRFDFFE
jgi:CRISPR-associated protein Cas2